MGIEAVYGPLCGEWIPDSPLEIQDGCPHDSCWYVGTWGRITKVPEGWPWI